MKDLSQRRYVSAYLFAVIYAGMDEKDQAFDWLHEAYQNRDEGLAYIKTDPRLDRLRADPRFQDLQRRMGLPP